MKIIRFTLLFSLLIQVVHAQSPKTALIENDFGGGMVKEIFLVRADDESIKEGTYQQFFNDSLITRGRYTDNKKTGLWAYFDYSGALNFSGNFNNDIKVGKWVYTLNDKLSAELFYSLGKTDSIFGFFENGHPAVEVRSYADGIGMIRTYYDNGFLKEEQPTKNGKPHGLYKIYFKNGQLHRTVKYENAMIKSVVETYDMSGHAIDGGSLDEGNGSLVSYYLSDTTAIIAMRKFRNLGFSNGALNGIASHYYENGVLESSGFTEQGLTVGEWKYYKDDGTLLHVINYNFSPFSDSKRQLKPEIYSGIEINTGQRNPQFQGGEEVWLDFLINTIRYPNHAEEYPALGIVYVDFVVTDMGNVVSERVVKSVNSALDAEALRVLREMPRWNPGLHYGIPVRMMMNMPLSFNIE